jgi:hypothetical protein
MFGTPSRIRRKHEAPRASAILTIDEYWRFDMQIRERLLGLTNIETDVLTPVENFAAKGMSPKALLWTNPPLCLPPPAVSERFPLFLDLEWNTFDFEWCCGVPEWTWWFDMYVWVLHTTQPKVKMVTVYVQQVQSCWQVLLAYTQTQDVTYSNARKFLHASRTAFDATPMDLESPEIITVHLILSIVALLCDGNRKFRDSCFHRISQLVCTTYAACAVLVLRGADTYAHGLSLSEIKRSQTAVSASDQFSFAS